MNKIAKTVADNIKHEVARHFDIDPSFITYKRIPSKSINKRTLNEMSPFRHRLPAKSLGSYIYGSGKINLKTSQTFLQSDEFNELEQEMVKNNNNSTFNPNLKLQENVNASIQNSNMFPTIIDITTFYRNQKPTIELSYSNDIFADARQGFNDNSWEEEDDEDNYDWEDDDDDDVDENNDMELKSGYEDKNDIDDIDDGKDNGGSSGGTKSNKSVIKSPEDNTNGGNKPSK